MSWDKLTFLRVLFPTREAAGPVARRWWRAKNEQPLLAQDLIVLGGVLMTQPADENGPAPIDPIRMAYEAGQRDLALKILAMMNLTPYELNSILEDNRVS